MNANEQTLQQIERAVRKVADKFPASQEASMLTDIHLRVNQDSGELVAFDDDDHEITRCVVEQWIDNKSESFYDDVTPLIRQSIEQQRQLVDSMSVLKPYSFVLEDEDKESIAELYVVDDDTIIIDPNLMEDLDKDLDDFLNNLLKN